MSGFLDKVKGYATDKIANVRKPEASVTGVSYKSVSRQGITLHSEVDVNNPYSHRLPICEISYSLKSDGRFLLKKRGETMASFIDKAKEFVADKIAHVPKPEASVTGVSFKGVTRECITLHSEVDVNNPYSHRLPICEVTYSLKSGEKVIASGTMPDPGWIAASGLTKLELPMKVPYDFLMSLVKDIGKDWDIDYLLEVGLTIDLPIVGQFTIPLKTSGEFELPTLADFFK
ncbi:hypothetical protein LUZ61_005493 [Rhynchospora tenuis]|uniref:Water stress and hypersensitive response domain-containing protein n=1 Tax=Rhynchospora tenuis TaxID=198213 RepID=A0AAD6EUQ0_9POAL|nr:hypothetical protein LUZ61_005493 [Rhynchospora tenuis]